MQGQRLLENLEQGSVAVALQALAPMAALMGWAGVECLQLCHSEGGSGWWVCDSGVWRRVVSWVGAPRPYFPSVLP